VVAPATKDIIPDSIDQLLDVDTTTAPPAGGDVLAWIAADNTWQPLAMRLDLLSGVTFGATPATGNLLRFNTDHWENWIPDYLNPTNGYTKTEVDNKLNSAVLGLEHEAAVLSRTDIPPTTPVLGDVHIVGVTPTGVWVGNSNSLARWDGAAWQFSAPRANESHLVEDVGETWHWNGTNWVKVAVAATASAASGDLYQVGSIQQSLLTETQWASVIGPEAVKWVLADGRNVAGSRYATVTGQTTVPDLRGAFIRAAGQNNNASANWNGGAVGAFHEDTTRLPRNTAFTATTSMDGSHHHASGVPGYDTEQGSIYGRIAAPAGKQTPNYDGSAPMTPLTSDAGAHWHQVTMTGGDVETAPVHYGLNFFIKIN
jgi:hypothetical protein